MNLALAWVASEDRQEFLESLPEKERGQNDSLACWVARSPEALADFLARMTVAQQAAAQYDWSFHARPTQLPPEGEWRFWLVMAGRGFGKTRVGAEWVRAQCESNQKARIALVAATRSECRDVMIEGESGILACCPPWNRPKYYPSRLLLIWPNGARAKGYGAEKPERLRGLNITGAWCDEWAAWSERVEDAGAGASGDRVDSWKNLRLSLRKGNCQCVMTTTPRRKRRLREFVKRAEKARERYRITRGSTRDNLRNLSGAFDEVIEDLEGTRVGRQELDGELLEDVEGALWSELLIDASRVDPAAVNIEELGLVKIAIGVDPATKTASDSDPSGIVVAGITRHGTCYVIEDATDKYTPPQWGRKVLDLVAKWRKVAPVRVVIETNKIGQMAEHNIRLCLNKGERMPKVTETHSSDGKEIRAEPFVSLYEKGGCKHYGSHPQLESCMTEWIPGTTSGSPDPLDALVHALRELKPNYGVPRIGGKAKEGAKAA
jgi:phage terminase large subunit-like protein